MSGRKGSIGKKRSNASIRDYETERVIAQLEPILSKLRSEQTLQEELSSVNARQLAQLITQLLQFNEEAFGIDAPQESRNVMTKLPFSCFRDFDPDNGALLHILRTSYLFKIENEWRRFDLSASNQKRKDKNIELFVRIRSVLEEKGLLRKKLFYLDVPGETQTELESLVNRMSLCGLVHDKRQATHIVERDPEHLTESATGTDDYLRTIEQRDNNAYVHWWYYPDSYDQWLPRTDVEGESEPEPSQSKKQWRVHARYLRDSGRFNEWMNETDYDLDVLEEGENDRQNLEQESKIKKSHEQLAGEIEESVVRSTNKRPRRRKSNTKEEITTTTPSKKRSADDAELEEGNTKKRTKSDTEKQDQDSKKEEQHRGNNVQSKEQENAINDETMNKSSTQVQSQPASASQTQEEAQKQTTQQVNQTTTIPSVIIPSHSAWFKMDEINDIEKRALPEFFDSKTPGKNPTVYKQYRNYMINTFRKDTSRYLTATECRKVLTGDVCAIMRVHSFLEHWGLINYGVDPRNKPIPLQALSSSQQVNNVYHDYTREQQQMGGPNMNLTATDRLMIFSNVTSMPSTSRFTVPQAQPNVQQQAGDWSDEETLRLLDAVDKYKDDWTAVAQMVGNNKTREQCLMHFVQLPIEDTFLMENDGAVQGSSSSVSSAEQPLPFADTTNPIMSTVAFLSSMVSPSVAAAAAQAALGAFDREQQSSISDINSANFDVTKLDVKTASATALGAASMRAKLIANKEEREIQRLVVFVIEKQLKKLELKIKHFEQLEALLNKERLELENARQKLLEDRCAMQQQGNQQ